jgi:hypothetical protein
MARKPRAAQLGVSPADYERMLAAQDGHCALCPNTPKTRRLSVDHNHKTGAVRGLLCFSCNRTLPHYKDSAWLARAATYVAAHEPDSDNIVITTRPKRPPRDLAREEEMRQMRASGQSLQKIADHYSISRQRVHQIVQGEK